MRTHRPPTTCPVCSDSLITLRLGCASCGTEVSGHFDSCRFCRLDQADMAILEVFLRSRGNIRDVQGHLAVSYPTARARLVEVLERLGLGADPEPGAPDAPAPAAPASATADADSPAPAAETARGGDPAGRERDRAPADERSPAPGSVAESVLADLAAGRIEVAVAEQLLAGLTVRMVP
jgi:hypothetical protein